MNDDPGKLTIRSLQASIASDDCDFINGYWQLPCLLMTTDPGDTDGHTGVTTNMVSELIQ